jgi:hypothetical protein
MMAKRKQSAIVSPKEKHARHASPSPADDNNSTASNVRGTTPQESVNESATAATSKKAEELIAEDDISES